MPQDEQRPDMQRTPVRAPRPEQELHRRPPRDGARALTRGLVQRADEPVTASAAEDGGESGALAGGHRVTVARSLDASMRQSAHVSV
jgi:hypothetical protein